jgi:hypothetical protein
MIYHFWWQFDKIISCPFHGIKEMGTRVQENEYLRG